MISEVAATVGKVSAEVAKEATKEAAVEVGKNAAGMTVDIAKRVDITKITASIESRGVDITKRIVPEVKTELSTKEIAESLKQYVSDLKAKAAFSDTIPDNILEKAKLEIRDPEQVEKLRDEFDDNKAKLRKEWEALNHREWPKYNQDVYNENGVRIRKAGDNYDAHHIHPLKLGGENVASNITPMELFKHSEIHSGSGSCTKLLESVEGAIKR